MRSPIVATMAVISSLAQRAARLSCRWSAQAGFGGWLPGLGLGDPLADDGRVAARVEGGPVLAELAVVVGDLLALPRPSARLGRVLGAVESVDRGAQMGRAERRAEPGVERGHDLGFAQVHGARVAARGWCGRTRWGRCTDSRAGRCSSCPACAGGRSRRTAARAGCKAAGLIAGAAIWRAFLRASSCWACLKVSSSMTGGCDDLFGEDPLIFVVPPHLGRMAERDVVDVD